MKQENFGKNLQINTCIWVICNKIFANKSDAKEEIKTWWQHWLYKENKYYVGMTEETWDPMEA